MEIENANIIQPIFSVKSAKHDQLVVPNLRSVAVPSIVLDNNVNYSDLTATKLLPMRYEYLSVGLSPVVAHFDQVFVSNVIRHQSQ